jgi:mono/diheme cytochrome c family protein
MTKAIITVVFLATACGGTHKSATSTPKKSEPVDIVAQGATLYGAHCAKCHGDAGQGTAKAPPVVGAQAFPLDPRPGQKRNVQFHTALDVFVWAKTNMPGDDPGSLSDADLLAIFAFDLKANGVDLTGKLPLDGDIAKQIVLH